jgi:hypothetical protein
MSTSSTRFVLEWRQFMGPDGEVVYRPLLPVVARGRRGFVERDFLVDSGADLSMAPYELCLSLGLRWRDGPLTILQGISRRKTCAVEGRIHEVDIVIPDGGVILRLSMVFVRGNAPYVLGRTGFFDVFDIAFEMGRRRTIFELADR